MENTPTKKEMLFGLGLGASLIIAFVVLGNFLSTREAFQGVAQAVYFDSDIVPVAGSSINLGVSQGQIGSINSTLFFSGSSVGIGAVPQTTNYVRLHIEGGGLRFNNLTSGLPSCNASVRGMMWFSPGPPDSLSLCYWNGTGYGWATFQGK